MLMALGIENKENARAVYQSEFELPFLAQSAEFYRVGISLAPNILLWLFFSHTYPAKIKINTL